MSLLLSLGVAGEKMTHYGSLSSEPSRNEIEVSHYVCSLIFREQVVSSPR